MIIKEGQKLLVLRVGDYKKHSFIAEHESVILNNGFSWMLKLGKPIPFSSLENTVGDSKIIILRTPKAAGGKLYVCECNSFRNGTVLSEFVYPQYYHELFAEYYWYQMEGSWFCLNSIKPLQEGFYDKLFLANNDKPLLQALSETRTTAMYVRSCCDITA